MFDGIESFEEGLRKFDFQVMEGEHVCGDPEGCQAATICAPVCRLIAVITSLICMCKASKEESERLETMSLEQWLQVALREHAAVTELVTSSA